MKSKERSSIAAILILSILMAFTGFVSAEITEVITDSEDDVFVADYLSLDESGFGKNEVRPNIDIVKLTYIKEESGTSVTIKLEVNSEGEIEDRNDFDSLESGDYNDSLDITGSAITYMVELETDSNIYSINYMDQICDIGGEETDDFTVSGNELTVTFDLEDSAEELVTMYASTNEIAITSLSDMKVYMDIAPNDFALLASISATPTNQEPGEEISFIGEVDDLFEISVPPYEYSWDFDDGSTGTGPEVTHSYQYPGTYTVELTVSDSEGTEASTTQTITISQESTSNGDSNPDNGGETSEDTEDSPIMIFVAIIGIIVVIGVIALVVVIRR